MEPEPQQFDRETVRADHRAVSNRIDREVEAMLAAAATKRRAYLDETVDHLRAEVEQQRPTTPGEGAAPPATATRSATHEAAHLLLRLAAVEAELARASAARDELEALLAIAEREREQAHAELRTQSGRADDLDRQVQELRAPAPSSEPPAEDAAAALLLAAARAADDVRDASRARAVRTLTKARDLAALVRAETEREREALVEAQRRRAEVEGEAQEILMEAHVTAERFVAGVAAACRAEAEREAEELLAAGRVEAERIRAAASDERHRLREILASTLSELDADGAAPADDLIADLESRLHETADG